MGEISIRERLPRDTLWILAFACVLWAALTVVAYGFGYDSHAYWLAWREETLYSRAPTTQDAFLYSPAFAQVIWPLAQLPYPVFGLLFTVAPAIAFAWLLSPLPRRTAVPVWLMTTPEIVTGNVFWLLALAAAVGLRHPASWAAMALTKVTPCLGPVWFLVRKEWRSLAISVGVTFAIVLASYAIDASAWRAWVSFLVDQQTGTTRSLGSPLFPPLLVRAPVAIALVWWGARRDMPLVLPIAMVVATPVLATASFTMLTAIPRLKARVSVRPPGLTTAPTE